jgi:hypothetical protein
MAVRPYAEYAPTLGGVYLYLTYDAGFVAEIKSLVPPEARHWDSEEKVWYVGQAYAHRAIGLARKFWPHINTSAYDNQRNTGYDHARARRGQSQQGYRWDWFGTGGQHQTGYARGDTSFSSGGSAGHPALATLFVTSGAPPEVVKAAYRALALLYHPDKGGDPSKMRELNEAYDQLRKAGKA